MVQFLVIVVVGLAVYTMVAERRRKGDLAAIKENLRILKEVKKDA